MKVYYEHFKNISEDLEILKSLPEQGMCYASDDIHFILNKLQSEYKYYESNLIQRLFWSICEVVEELEEREIGDTLSLPDSGSLKDFISIDAGKVRDLNNLIIAYFEELRKKYFSLNDSEKMATKKYFYIKCEILKAFLGVCDD